MVERFERLQPRAFRTPVYHSADKYLACAYDVSGTIYQGGSSDQKYKISTLSGE